MTRRVLSVFTLTMITIGSVDSIRNLPSTALFGSSLIFFFVIGAIGFLIPSALVSAELSSSWPERGGVYIWVREAFGVRFGFLAIWFQWIENVVWYPAILSFIGGTLGFIIDSLCGTSLTKNPLFLVTIIIVVFWSMTIINLFGMRSSAWISNICSIAGLIIPMAIIIALGVIWLAGGHPMQVHFTAHDMLPNFGNSNIWVSLTGIMLSFCGMEIATVHAREAKDPQHAFPKALLFSVIIILFTLIFGSLTLAVVLPAKHISLVAGIMQAFSLFFHAYHLTWLIPVLGFMLILGGIGGVNNWIIAPTKGLMVAAQDGNLPKILRKENQYNAPSALLIVQAIVVTLLALAFLLFQSVNESYWLLNVLASQIYMMMYILMFAAGIYLRYKKPDRHRPYHIPIGNIGMICVAGAGIIAALLTITVGFFPPEMLHIKHIYNYEAVVITSLLVVIILPLIIAKMVKPRLI